MLHQLIDFFINYGYFAVFSVLLLCGFGFPIPEDVVLVAGGVFAAFSCPASLSFRAAMQSCHSVHVMFGVAMAGVLIGDSIMFFIGYYFGDKLLNKKFVTKVLTEKRRGWIQEKFEKHGAFFIFLARFMPGLRSPIFVVSGITRKVSYVKFVLVDGFAALISVPLWVYLGFWGQRQIDDIGDLNHYIHRGQMSILLIIGLVIAALFLVWLIKKMIKQKTHFLD